MPITSRKRQKELESILDTLPVTYEVQPTKKRNLHFAFKLTHKGNEQVFFFSGTPSDHNADRRKLAAIKRWIQDPNWVTYSRDVG